MDRLKRLLTSPQNMYIRNQDERRQEILSHLAKIIEDDPIQDVYRQLEQCIDEESMVKILMEHTSPKKAKSLAHEIFEKMGKDKCTYNRLEYLYSDLKNQEVPTKTIQQIKIYAYHKKKKRLHDELIKAVGQHKGERLYEKYGMEIKQMEAMPYEDAVRVRTLQGNFDFYQYPQSLVDERMKNEAKTMMVFGETGSGKSTFLNAIVNYLAMVDIEDSFRYQLVVQNFQSELLSKTKEIKTYYALNAKNNRQCYRIIDTPGFGDTEGINKDDQNIENIKSFLSQSPFQIHVILFVLKASTNRITPFQKYIFQSVMDLFGKDIAKNFCFIFTFSDSGDPQVLQAVKDNQHGFGRYWQVISQPKYLQVNSCGIFKKIESADKKSNLKQSYWKIGMEYIGQLIEKVKKMEGNSLLMTKEVIKKKEHLAFRLRKSRNSLQDSIAKQQTLHDYIQTISKWSQQIDNNKNFEYFVPITQYYGVKTEKNVTRCQTCMNTNCHLGCNYGEGQPKRHCIAMDKNGNCTICDRKCSHLNHYNSKEERKARTINVKETNETLKYRYEMAINQKNVAQKAIKNLIKELDESIMKTALYANEILALEDELNQICMTNRRQETVIEYLRYLISQQRKNKQQGYEKRIDTFQESIRHYEIIEKFVKGGLKQEAKKIIEEVQRVRQGNPKKKQENASQIWAGMLDQTRMERNQRIIEKANPELWQKIKKSFIDPQNN